MQQLSRPCRGRLPRPAPSCWGGHGRVWGAGRPHRALATDVLELLESGDDDDHKALYCYGASLGRQLKDTFSCLQEDELDVVLAGLRGCILNEPPLLSSAELSEFMPQGPEVLKAKQEAAAAGDDAQQTQASMALAEAARMPHARKTPTGLVYLELVAGSGAAPTAKDTVQVHYEGRLPDGTVFDSSIERGQPVQFPLDAVIAGWTEGLQLMRVGGKALLTIPASLGYVSPCVPNTRS